MGVEGSLGWGLKKPEMGVEGSLGWEFEHLRLSIQYFQRQRASCMDNVSYWASCKNPPA